MKGIAIRVGIDWADQKHDFSYQVEGTNKIARGSFKHSAKAIDVWVQSLRKKAPNGKIAICLEQSRGSLVFALMKYDFIELYPVNPKSLARYREAWSPSRAKDDPVDAAYLFEILSRHSDKISAWKPEPEDVRLLQRLVEQRQKLVHDVKRLGNRLTNALKEYFPLVLELFPKIYKNIVADFLLQFPTLEKLQSTADQELLCFFRSHSSTSAVKNKTRLEAIRSALALVTDTAVIESNALLVQAIAREIKVLNDSIALFEERISALYSKQPDRQIFESLPSAGDITGPKLFAALGTDRSRFDSAYDFQSFSGVAPVVERSGNSCWTHWRLFRPKHVSQAFIDFAFLSVRSSFWAEAFYASQRAKGKTHNVAIRALAFKWQRIIFKMWKSKTTYSETRYLKALNASGSHLVKHFKQAA